MKKSLVFISLLALCACTKATDAGNGLTRLQSEPTDCEFLYTLDSNIMTYKLSEAYDYLEQSILQQKTLGDSYYIVNEDIFDNSGAIFGPDHTYKFKVKVYNCNK